MRQVRDWRTPAKTAIAFGLLLISSGCAATPPGSALPASSPSVIPIPSPTASESASAAVDIICESAILNPDPIRAFEVVRGGTARLRFSGFPPNTALDLFTSNPDMTPRPMGRFASDGEGGGVIDAVIPLDAPVGEVWLYLSASAACFADTYVVVTAT